MLAELGLEAKAEGEADAAGAAAAAASSKAAKRKAKKAQQVGCGGKISGGAAGMAHFTARLASASVLGG